MYLSILALLIVSGLLTAYVNSQRGYSGVAGFVVGFFLGPVGFVLALISAPNQAKLLYRDEELEAERVAQGERKQCPYCAEVIRPTARVCRYCGRDLSPEASPAHVFAPVMTRIEPAPESRQLAPASTVPQDHSLRLSQPTGVMGGPSDGQHGDDISINSVRHLLQLLDALAEKALHADTGRPPSSDQETGPLDGENAERGERRQPRLFPTHISLDGPDAQVIDSPLDKARFFWLLENGEIPEVAAGINLQRREKCHFVGRADWWEQAGTHIESGRVFVTNRRLIFLGTQNNKSVLLSEILDFTPYQKGVEVKKESGRNFFLALPDDVDVFAMILGRVMEQAE